MSLITLPLTVGPLQCNCVILADADTLDAVVVDPGDEADVVLRAMRAHRLQCHAILNTHAHIDHVGANHAVKAATGASVHLHAADQPLYEKMPAQAAALAGLLPVPRLDPIDVFINDGDRLRFGTISIEVIHTPGHSPGSVCFLVDGQSPPLLLSGDTLFAGGIGRTDLWGGDLELELRSIKMRLMPLADCTRVIPGHGAITTIGDERRDNYLLRNGDCS